MSASWGCLIPRGGCLLPSGGVCFLGLSASQGGVCFLGDQLPGVDGVSASRRGCLLLGAVYPSMHWGRHPPVDRMTDRCKNITFPQLRLRTVKMLFTSHEI